MKPQIVINGRLLGISHTLCLRMYIEVAVEMVEGKLYRQGFNADQDWADELATLKEIEAIINED